MSAASLLLNSKANVNARAGQARSTAVHRAAVCGHVDMVQMLLAASAQPHLQDSDGRTALHKAIEGGHVAVAQVIAEAALAEIFVLTDNKGEAVPGEPIVHLALARRSMRIPANPNPAPSPPPPSLEAARAMARPGNRLHAAQRCTHMLCGVRLFSSLFCYFGRGIVRGQAKGVAQHGARAARNARIRRTAAAFALDCLAAAPLRNVQDDERRADRCATACGVTAPGWCH